VRFPGCGGISTPPAPTAITAAPPEVIPVVTAAPPMVTLAPQAERPNYKAGPPWASGDIVMAPGSQDCATLSKIVEIVGNKAFMHSAHGYEGWVFVRQIRPVGVEKGQDIKLYKMREGGGHDIWEGVVLEVENERVRVKHDIDFDNPGKKEWVPWRAIGVPCDPIGPACLPEEEFHFYEHLRPGVRVWAPWEYQYNYVGAVRKVKEHDVHIEFDSGNCGWVLMGQVFPFWLTLDQWIECRWKGTKQYGCGAILAIEEDRLHFRFENGGKQWVHLGDIRSENRGAPIDDRPNKYISKSQWVRLVDE